MLVLLLRLLRHLGELKGLSVSHLLSKSVKSLERSPNDTGGAFAAFGEVSNSRSAFLREQI